MVCPHCGSERLVLVRSFVAEEKSYVEKKDGRTWIAKPWHFFFEDIQDIAASVVCQDCTRLVESNVDFITTEDPDPVLDGAEHLSAA